MNQFDIKELFIKNIKDNTTLNIALALVEEWSNYKNVLDKIKEEVLTELQTCKPKNMAISMEINYIEEKLEKLLEEIE